MKNENRLSAQPPRSVGGPRWSRHVFFTLDFDWACDEVLRFCLEFLQGINLDRATFFATHSTDVLADMEMCGYELGIHPNFLPAMQGKAAKVPAEILKEMRRAIPNACSVRSDGLVRSSHLSALFAENGLTHECNLLVPPTARFPLDAYELPAGLLQVPHRWGDSWQLAQEEWIPPEELLAQPGLRVLLFHPIHVFLNTRSLNHFECAKRSGRDFGKLRTLVNSDEREVRDYPKACVFFAQAHGREFFRVDEIALRLLNHIRERSACSVARFAPSGEQSFPGKTEKSAAPFPDKSRS